MGTKARALGADAALRGVFETTYGTVPASGYGLLDFKSFGVDSDKPLGNDALLGRGRDAQDPYFDRITVDGPIGVPLDVQGIGLWLKGLLGAPTTTTVAAAGTISFSAQPADASTITLNGTTWTFVSGAPSGNQTQIQGTLIGTIDQLVTDLEASADAEVSKCTYSRVTGTETLTIVNDTAGTGGNSYTIAADAPSNGTASAATLLGGGYSHVFTSGGALPSMSMEIGHPELSTPKFYRFFGCKLGTLAFDLATSGPANATIDVIAQGRQAAASTTIDGAATAFTLTRFSQSGGAIKKDGTQVGSVTGGRFNFTNNLEPVVTIRADGLIDGIDEGVAAASGSIDVRFGSDSTLEDAALAETPVAFEYSFVHPLQWSLTFDMPRVFLPKPKNAIDGPGGIQASFDLQAAYDETATHMLKVTLINDVAGY